MTHRYKTLTLGAAGFAASVVLWQLAAIGPMSGTALPTVTSTAARLVRMFMAEPFWQATLVTVLVAVVGLIIAAAIGICCGILIGNFEPVRYASLAILEFIKPIPPIVILPLVVLVLGPTTQMTLFLVVLFCMVSIIIQTVAGVHDTDPVMRDTARSYGLGSTEILRRIVLPSALPFIGTAIRVCAPAALIITVVAGLLGGGPGLGRSILLAQNGGDYPQLYALVIVLGGLGLIFQFATGAIERRLLHWHESQREAVHA